MNLKELYKIFKDSPDSNWIVGFDDYLQMSKIIKERGVKNILELGGGVGCCAAVMAHLGANVTSVEQYEKCIKIAKKLIPRDLQKKITFHHSETGVLAVPQIQFQYFMNYKNVPKGDWDMVVIDGCGPFLRDGFLVKLPNGDFINLIKDTKPGTLFYIDGRRETVMAIQRFFSLYFEVISSDNNYTLLRRTREVEDKIQIVDLYLRIYKEKKYL